MSRVGSACRITEFIYFGLSISNNINDNMYLG